MKSIKLLFLVSTISLSILQFTGCTAIGLLAGLSSDASQVDGFNQTTHEIHDFDPGISMEVNLANGDTINGEFLRLETITADDYVMKYESYRTSVASEITLPKLYDSIAVNQNDDYDYIFLGFDYGCMKVKTKRYNTFAKIYLTNIYHICDSKNNCLEGKRLREIIAEGDLPLLSDIVLMKENNEVKIPTEELIQGRCTDKHYGWLIGLSAGLAADALFVTIAVIPNTDFTGMGNWGN